MRVVYSFLRRALDPLQQFILEIGHVRNSYEKFRFQIFPEREKYVSKSIIDKRVIAPNNIIHRFKKTHIWKMMYYRKSKRNLFLTKV